MHSKDRSGACGKIALTLASLVLTAAMGCATPPNPVLRQQGMNALHDGDVSRAEDRFTRAVDRDPTDWKSLYYLGLVRLRQNRPLDAQLVLEKSLSLRPSQDETPDILDAYAQSLLKQDKAAQLQAMLQQAVSDYGTMRDYLRQAECLAKLGDADGAETAFHKAIHFADPKDPTPFVKLADFYEAAGNKPKALHALIEAYSVDPGSISIKNRLRSKKYDVVPGPTIIIVPDR